MGVKGRKRGEGKEREERAEVCGNVVCKVGQLGGEEEGDQ